MSALPATVAVAEDPPSAPPLSPGRDALQGAIAALRAAEAAFDEADRPVQVVNGAAARPAEAEAELAALHAEWQ
jgi:hypothetical protein